MEKRIGGWTAQALVSASAYPEGSGYRPERGDVSYNATVTIGDEDGMANAEFSFASSTLRGLVTEARRFGEISMRDPDERLDAIDIAALVAGACEEFVEITGGCRADG